MKRSKGFTLIELVVVIAVLGILAGVVIPRFLNAQASAKGAKVLGNLRSIDSAVNVFMSKNGRAPTMAELTEGDNKLIEIEQGYHQGDFIVRTHAGEEKTYIEDGLYGINSENRAYLGSATHTVDYYLGLTGSLADNMSRILSIFNNVMAGNNPLNKKSTILDSTAANVDGKIVGSAIEALKDAGLDLEAMGVKSWRYDSLSYGGRLLFSTQDISQMTESTRPVVVQYRVYSGNYTVWKDASLKMDPLGYIRFDGAGRNILNANQADQTYDRAMEIYRNAIK